MGRRTVLNKHPVLSAVNSAVTNTSVQTDVSGLDFITYQLIVATLVNAVLEVQYCNDVVISPSSTFVPLSFAATLSLIGATDVNYTVSIENQGFKWLKLQTTNNGGSGVISSWVTGTVKGA